MQPEVQTTPPEPTNNSSPASSTLPQQAASERIIRGLLLSLIAIPIGIALWVVLWIYGFMASLVSFVIAFLAIWLYKKGAGYVSKRSAPLLVGVIILGIVLSFLSGMASDALMVYIEDSKESATSALLSGEFWEFFLMNIFTNGELWASYIVDILIAVVFGALGVFGIIKELFRPSDSTATEPDASTKTV